MANASPLLVVEDNPDDEALIVRGLRDVGHQGKVVVAHDGLEALERLYKGRAQPAMDPPALVLLDLKMPRMNGFELLRAVRTDPALLHLPIVVFTSSGDPQDVEAAYELGATSNIQKPLDYQEFLSVLRGILTFWFRLSQPRPRPVEGLQGPL